MPDQRKGKGGGVEDVAGGQTIYGVRSIIIYIDTQGYGGREWTQVGTKLMDEKYAQSFVLCHLGSLE